MAGGKKSKPSLDKATSDGSGLLLTPSADVPLSRVQLEFNRLMQRLEKAQAKHAKEQAALDELLHRCIHELMPMVEKLNRLNRDMVFSAKRALDLLKLTPKRQKWFADLISGKAADLLKDPAGLSHADLELLQAIIDEIGPSIADLRLKESEEAEFDILRSMIEGVAKNAGLDLDLSDLDLDNPEEFDRQVRERLAQAEESFEQSEKDEEARRAASKRKPTKAQLEKERKLREQEEAKARDYKSLYKQLAKVLHPDLEPDPVLKEHKEVWMKRLTSAYANGDLRDMLQIEMEWLGEEAGDLANASDAKLKVYCSVLKEQIAGLKIKTENLSLEPQYQVIDRFCDPYFGGMPHPVAIKMDLEDSIREYEEMLHTLESDENARLKIIHRLADSHARACSRR